MCIICQYANVPIKNANVSINWHIGILAHYYIIYLIKNEKRSIFFNATPVPFATA